MHSFTFSLSFNIFFLLLFLNDNFAAFRVLGWQLWFWAHWMCSLPDVWPPLFLMRICLFILVGFPVSNELFSSCCFQDFSPCLWLSPFLLWLVCLWISLHLSFEFAELHGCVMFSNIFCEFSTAISSHFFCSYLSSPSGTHFVCIDVLSTVSYSSECLVFFILFFSFCSSGCKISINLFSALLIISSAFSSLLLSSSNEVFIENFNSRISM